MASEEISPKSFFIGLRCAWAISGAIDWGALRRQAQWVGVGYIYNYEETTIHVLPIESDWAIVIDRSVNYLSAKIGDLEVKHKFVRR